MKWPRAANSTYYKIQKTRINLANLLQLRCQSPFGFSDHFPYRAEDKREIARFYTLFEAWHPMTVHSICNHHGGRIQKWPRNHETMPLGVS
jgi:hypothetical protein